MAPASLGKLRWDGVVYRRLRSPAAGVETAVVRRQDEDSPMVRAFLEVVREVAARGGDRSALLGGPSGR